MIIVSEQTDGTAKALQRVEKMGDISDGYHTFNELYESRMLYNAAFVSLANFFEQTGWVHGYNAHKSTRHHDGEECFGGGWFVVMFYLPGEAQISNHYEMKDWYKFDIPERERADEWDGHTPAEAVKRLTEWLDYKNPEKK